MDRVDDFAEDPLLGSQFLKSLNSMCVEYLLFDDLGEILAMLSIDLIDPDGIEELKHQEITEERLLLGLLGLVNIASQHCLLESILHYEVLGYFLE